MFMGCRMLTIAFDNYPREELSPSAALELPSSTPLTIRRRAANHIRLFCGRRAHPLLHAGHAARAAKERRACCSREDRINWYEVIATKCTYTTPCSYSLPTGSPKNIEGKSYTFERLCEVVEKSPRSMKDILKAVEVDLVEFCEGMLPHDSDDTTLLLITLK